MGHIWVEAAIFNLGKTKSKKVNALVDTGATLTTIPLALAEELGIQIVSKEDIQTGAGIIKIQRGEARIKIKEKESTQDVWISDIIEKCLIGTVTLEVLGFKVNPITEKIEETQLMLY